MEKHKVKIISIDKVTYDVVRITTEKPADYNFVPGQATEISINKVGWENENRPFTFTSLPTDDHLEFTIKIYHQNKGVTNELNQMKKGDELFVHDVFGAISYKGEGVFIAGGAGVTPFISIFRYLKSENKIGGNQLFFANKAKEDIINEKEFKALLGDKFINILSDEQIGGYVYGRMSEETLKKYVKDFTKQFYLCGPPIMVTVVLKQLKNLGVPEENITIEL